MVSIWTDMFIHISEILVVLIIRNKSFDNNNSNSNNNYGVYDQPLTSQKHKEWKKRKKRKEYIYNIHSL